MVRSTLRESSCNEKRNLAYAANIKTDPTLNKFSLKTKVSAQDLREFSGVPHLFGAPEFPGI
jgi:hypothetical protein